MPDDLILFKRMDFLPFRSEKCKTKGLRCNNCNALMYPYHVLRRFFKNLLLLRFINFSTIPALRKIPELLSMYNLFKLVCFVKTHTLSTFLRKRLAAILSRVDATFTGKSGYNENDGA